MARKPNLNLLIAYASLPTRTLLRFVRGLWYVSRRVGTFKDSRWEDVAHWLRFLQRRAWETSGRGTRQSVALVDLFRANEPLVHAIACAERRYDPADTAWDNTTVRAVASDIYESREWENTPVLADALEEAGCTDAKLLAALRRV